MIEWIKFQLWKFKYRKWLKQFKDAGRMIMWK